LNKRERVLKTLDIEEPDIVPITENGIDLPLMEAVTGKVFPTATSLQTQVIADRDLERKRVDLTIECFEKIGFDIYTLDLSAPEGWEPTVNPDGTMVDLWGRVLRIDEGSKAWVPYATVFNSPEDFENFKLPDPDSPGWTFSLEHALRTIDGDVALATFIRDPFAHAWEMFTPMKFVQWMYQKPRFIEGVLKALTDFNVKIIKQIAEWEMDLIISGGDYCEVKGPMVPIKFFRDIIFPCLKRQVESSHRHGIRFVKHTDGNVLPLLDDLAEIVDGVHSLDPTAGVDIGEVKLEYGEKIFLMGNVAVDNLARGSRSDIEEETKKCIKRASPGGGHILSSSNSWAAGAKLDNCLSLVETGRRYGSYPIRM